MSKRTCFIIFIAALVVIMASFVLGFGAVTGPVAETFAAMKGIYLTVSALIVSLLLLKQKYYWLLVLGCAVLAALLIQFFIVGGSLMSVAVLYKIAAFAVYAYLVQLVRYMI
ncbi:MAG: hypothetical protein Q4D80_01935 [Pseudomonadota bacterium]|nr:hypothetical protein [Pseudomonadota bacterium]